MSNTLYKLEDFELYQHACDFRKQIYKLISRLPSKEKFSLEPQMRRAVISVTNNIAEGHGRWHFQENIQFCRVARGSVEEIIDDLNICIDESYYPQSDLLDIKEEAYELVKRINGYISYLKKVKQS